jgi:hypothetical protein
MRTIVALILALLISGCASRTEDRRLSIKDTAAPAAAAPIPKQSLPKQSLPKQSSPKQSSPKQTSPKETSPKETSNCGERHLDHQAGRSPGGATTLEEKEADDRVCGEEYRYPGYLKLD